MSDFSDKIRLKEKAEEEIYFAKRDRELIEALHEKSRVEHPEHDTGGTEVPSRELQKEPANSTMQPRHGFGIIGGYLRKLIGRVLKSGS